MLVAQLCLTQDLTPTMTILGVILSTKESFSSLKHKDQITFCAPNYSVATLGACNSLIPQDYQEEENLPFLE